MKKLLSIIIAFSLIVMCACAQGNDDSPITEKNEAVISTITYVWDYFGLGEEGVEKMTEGISLPTEYVEGEGVILPKLKTWKQSSKVLYRFEGWYYDSNFQNKLEGNAIPKTQTGNLTIYSKIELWVG